MGGGEDRTTRGLLPCRRGGCTPAVEWLDHLVTGPPKTLGQMYQFCAKCARSVPIAWKPLRRTDVLLASRNGCLSHQSPGPRRAGHRPGRARPPPGGARPRPGWSRSGHQPGRAATGLAGPVTDQDGHAQAVNRGGRATGLAGRSARVVVTFLYAKTVTGGNAASQSGLMAAGGRWKGAIERTVPACAYGGWMMFVKPFQNTRLSAFHPVADTVNIDGNWGSLICV
jgi:hypothetical protein